MGTDGIGQFAGLHDQIEGLVVIQEPTGPTAQHIQWNVERAGYVTGGEAFGGPGVNHHRALGDQLVIEAEALHVRSRTGHCKCRAMVGKDLAAEAEIKFMLVDAEHD